MLSTRRRCSSSTTLVSFFFLILSLVSYFGISCASWSTSEFKNNATEASNDAAANTCTLYMAPSSIPQAGYGIFTTKSFRQHSTILSQDGPNIAVIDPYIIPGSSSYTSKFDDVWWAEANGMPDEMKYEGDVVVDYQIMLGALPNYHPYLHNIENRPHHDVNTVYQDDLDIIQPTDDEHDVVYGPGSGAFSYYKGKHFAAGHDIEAGDELFLDYGTSWLENRGEAYAHVPRNYDYTKAGEVLLSLLKDLNVEDMDELLSLSKSSTPETINRILTHTRRITSEAFDSPRVSSLLPKNEQQLKDVLAYAYNKKADNHKTCDGSSDDDKEEDNSCSSSQLPSKDMSEWVTAEDLGFAVAREISLNRRSVEWIHENGICVDHIVAGRSTAQHAGSGAIAQRRIAKGEIIVPVPLLHIMDREALRTYPVILAPKDQHQFNNNNNDDDDDDDADDDDQQGEATGKDSVEDLSTTDGHQHGDDGQSPPPRMFLQRDYSKTKMQLLLNYCFGHSMSSLLLCPVTNAILINHCSERKDSNHGCGIHGSGPNAEYQWATNPKWDTKTSKWLNKTLEELEMAQDWRLLSMEIVATRDIEAGEEIFMDYGPNWEAAWDKHVEKWEQPDNAGAFENHASVSELNKSQGPITASDDLVNEYSFSHDVFTMCWCWRHKEDNEYDEEDFYGGWKRLDEEEIMLRYGKSGHQFIRNPSTFDYGQFWPCSIIHKNEDGSGNSEVDDSTYTVRVYPSKTVAVPSWHRRGLPRFYTNFPRKSIQYFTKPYRSDQHLPGAFRHPIEINDDIFPEQWKNRKPGFYDVKQDTKFHPGDRVLANFLDRGEWFKAIIERVRSNGHYDVLYADDGMVEKDLDDSRIKKSDWVHFPLQHLTSSNFL